MLDKHLNRIEQHMFSADRNYGFLTLVVRTKVSRVPLNNRIAQLRSSRSSCVLGEVVIDGCDGCIFNMLRRGKVRLTHAEVYDVNTLLAQFVGLGYYRHGGGGVNASNTFGKFCDWHCFTHWGHTRFPGLIFRTLNFTAGSNFSLSRCSTISGTKPSMSPPSLAISRTSR